MQPFFLVSFLGVVDFLWKIHRNLLTIQREL